MEEEAVCQFRRPVRDSTPPFPIGLGPIVDQRDYHWNTFGITRQCKKLEDTCVKRTQRGQVLFWYVDPNGPNIQRRPEPFRQGPPLHEQQAHTNAQGSDWRGAAPITFPREDIARSGHA